MLGQPPDYREVAIRASAILDPLWCKPAGGGYDQPLEFRTTHKAKCEAEVAWLKADFAHQRVIHWWVGGDCHMKAAVKVFRSDEARRVRVVVKKIYGGCRASGHLAGAVVIDKPPAGYQVSLEVVGVGEGGENGFVFPSVPSTVRYQEVPHRRIDLSECLPLTGDSRRMITSREHLDPDPCRSAGREGVPRDAA